MQPYYNYFLIVYTTACKTRFIANAEFLPKWQCFLRKQFTNKRRHYAELIIYILDIFTYKES